MPLPTHKLPGSYANASISAAGSDQAGATGLTVNVNVITTAAASSGVRLPTPESGREISVINRGANAVSIYPNTGNTINSLAANTPITLAVNEWVKLVGVSGSAWQSQSGPPATAQSNAIKQSVTEVNTFAALNVVRRTGSSHSLAQANTAGNSASVVGIVESAGAGSFTYVASGVLSAPSHGFTVGDVLYLSAGTAGLLTNTAPATAGQVVRPMAVVDTNNTILVLASFTPSHSVTHISGGSDAIKLDDLSTPDDNTDLNASTSRHGLLPKLSNVATEFLTGTGTWAAPAGRGIDIVHAYGNAGQTLTPYVDAVLFTTKAQDTSAAYALATGVFTAPTNGLVVFSAALHNDLTSWASGYFYACDAGGTAIQQIFRVEATGGSSRAFLSGSFRMSASSTFHIRLAKSVSQTLYASSTQEFQYLTIQFYRD